MARDPNIPDAFDVYVMCLLRRPPNAPQLPEDELDRLQSAHLEHRAALKRQGKLVVNGPLDRQTDISLRGMSIFTTSIEEAASLNDADPLVQAGRLSYDLFEWWVAAGTLAFPGVEGRVGDVRSMDD
ncbi:MAG TPA: YciI family protein [Candidatus Limnocylindrales bacterium]|nr:YciI family protein [Candidatus Limnocylindrales bacterium]